MPTREQILTTVKARRELTEAQTSEHQARDKVRRLQSQLTTAHQELQVAIRNRLWCAKAYDFPEERLME